MSHISTYAQKITSIETFKNVLANRGIQYRENCNVQQFGQNIVQGAAIGFRLPGWKYEIAVMPDGRVLYDHWGSEANTMETLGLTLQAYNEDAIMEKAWGEEGVQNIWTEEFPNGVREIVLEYGT